LVKRQPIFIAAEEMAYFFLISS